MMFYVSVIVSSVCGLVLFSDYYSVIQELLCNICSVQDLFRLFATEII